MTSLVMLQVSTALAVLAHMLALFQIVLFKKHPRATIKRRYAVVAWAIASCLVMLLGQNIAGWFAGIYVQPLEALFYCWFAAIITLHKGNVARLFNRVPSYIDDEVFGCRSKRQHF